MQGWHAVPQIFKYLTRVDISYPLTTTSRRREQYAQGQMNDIRDDGALKCSLCLAALCLISTKAKCPNTSLNLPTLPDRLRLHAYLCICSQFNNIQC